MVWLSLTIGKTPFSSAAMFPLEISEYLTKATGNSYFLLLYFLEHSYYLLVCIMSHLIISPCIVFVLSVAISEVHDGGSCPLLRHFLTVFYESLT